MLSLVDRFDVHRVEREERRERGRGLRSRRQDDLAKARVRFGEILIYLILRFNFNCLVLPGAVKVEDMGSAIQLGTTSGATAKIVKTKNPQLTSAQQQDSGCSC